MRILSLDHGSSLGSHVGVVDWYCTELGGHLLEGILVEERMFVSQVFLSFLGDVLFIPVLLLINQIEI
jgi:hypothetical protein